MKSAIENRLTIVSIIIGLALLLAGLIVYTWNLHREVEQLRSQVDDPAINKQTEDPSWGSGYFGRPMNNPSFGPSFQDPFTQLRQTMDHLMQGQAFSAWNNSNPASFSHSTPQIHVDETGPEYLIRIEVPEHQELEINTTFEGDLFRVSGVFKQQQDLSDGGNRSYRSSESRFSRSFMLQDEVDEGNMIIENTDSEVIIRLPKNG